MKRPHTLTRWGIISLNGNGPHLAGYEVGQGTRTSTPLIEFDPLSGTALTASRRPYILVGAPDPAYGLTTALEVWGQYFDFGHSTVVPLCVDEAIQMITANGNQAYDRTIDEENALRREYGVPEVVDESEAVPLSEGISDLIIPDPEDGVGDEPGRKP